MPPYDAMGCPTMKFKYGKDCLCENRVACRGLTAAFSLLGNDPRSGFVRLPNYKAEPSSQYYVERNLQREAYLRYLLPNHPVQEETLAKDVALHHFHPRIVARLVSKLQKNIPRTMPEEELVRLKLNMHERDRLLDEQGNPTGRCIFAPNYPIESSKEDLKRLLRLCRTLNAVSKDKKEGESDERKASSPKPKKKKKQKFDPDIRSEGDLIVDNEEPGSQTSDSEERSPSPEPEEVDSLAEHNIQSLLESIIRLEPIREEELEEPNYDDLKVETLGTQETDLESMFTDEEESVAQHNTATVSMQVRLEKLHSGKGKKRVSKMMNKAPSPFFEISVLHEQESTSNRETIYRSYPLTDTKNATWDPIEALDLNVDIRTPQDLNFRITVFDCDMKGGNHSLIGASEVNALDLITTSSMSVPIRRDDKIKGFLEVSSFQLHTDKQNEILDDESLISEVSNHPVVTESASGEGVAYSPTTTNVGTSIQFAHPESPRERKKPTSDSPVLMETRLPIVSPDGSESTTPPASFSARIEKQTLPTSGDGEVDDSIDTFDDLSIVSALSMPSISMQISLEKLHTGKGKKKSLASKMWHKAPSPFFDFAVLFNNGHSTRWETLYQSYPLSETKKGTWDPIEELNLGVLVQAGEDLCFRITVRDCDTKSGNHRLIGVAEVRESELKETSTISIEREGKVKGLLRFDRFEVDWSA